MQQGVFITFEGIDGSGKSLLQNMVAGWLEEQGYDVITTREPGGSQLGQALRQQLLESNFTSLDPYSETLLFLADRSRHVEEIIKPALDSGKIVLSDRFIDSTIAYQGGGRGLDINQLKTLNDFAIRGCKPDLTVYFYVSIAKALSRQDSTKDRMEQENISFFENVAAIYEDLANEEPKRIKRIDGSADRYQVLDLVKPVISELLKTKEKPIVK